MCTHLLIMDSSIMHATCQLQPHAAGKTIHVPSTELSLLQKHMPLNYISQIKELRTLCMIGLWKARMLYIPEERRRAGIPKRENQIQSTDIGEHSISTSNVAITISYVTVYRPHICRQMKSIWARDPFLRHCSTGSNTNSR
jgi:hypothetical protein